MPLGMHVNIRELVLTSTSSVAARYRREPFPSVRRIRAWKVAVQSRDLRSDVVSFERAAETSRKSNWVVSDPGLCQGEYLPLKVWLCIWSKCQRRQSQRLRRFPEDRRFSKVHRYCFHLPPCTVRKRESILHHKPRSGTKPSAAPTKLPESARKKAGLNNFSVIGLHWQPSSRKLECKLYSLAVTYSCPRNSIFFKANPETLHVCENWKFLFQHYFRPKITKNESFGI